MGINRNQSLFWRWSIGVAIASVLVACSATSGNFVDEFTLDIAQPISAKVPETITYQTYIHPDNVFHIDIPQHWQIYRETPTEVIFFFHSTP